MPQSHGTATLPAAPSARGTSFHPVPLHSAQFSKAMVWIVSCTGRACARLLSFLASASAVGFLQLTAQTAMHWVRYLSRRCCSPRLFCRQNTVHKRLRQAVCVGKRWKAFPSMKGRPWKKPQTFFPLRSLTRKTIKKTKNQKREPVESPATRAALAQWHFAARGPGRAPPRATTPVAPPARIRPFVFPSRSSFRACSK